MIKAVQGFGEKGFVVNGNIVDVIAFLEKEQERYGKISVLQYVKQKKEQALNTAKHVEPSYKAGR